MEIINKPKKLDYSKVQNYKTKLMDFKIKTEDACLYSLCLGFSKDHFTQKDLKFTYELDKNYRIFPTFLAAMLLKFRNQLYNECPGVPNFINLDLLHTEVWFEVLKPLPKEGDLAIQGELIDVDDKGVGTFLVGAGKIMNKNDLSEVYAIAHHIVFIRGMDGAGVKSNGILKSRVARKLPSLPPHKEVRIKVQDNFVFFYRLIAGLKSPFHIDSVFSKVNDFDMPLLPGMCFYGLAAKEAYDAFCNDDPDNFVSLNCRFKSFVYPGETILIKFWRIEIGTAIISVEVVERNQQVLHGEFKYKFSSSKAIEKTSDSLKPKF